MCISRQRLVRSAKRALSVSCPAIGAAHRLPPRLQFFSFKPPAGTLSSRLKRTWDVSQCCVFADRFRRHARKSADFNRVKGCAAIKSRDKRRGVLKRIEYFAHTIIERGRLFCTGMPKLISRPALETGLNPIPVTPSLFLAQVSLLGANFANFRGFSAREAA